MKPNMLYLLPLFSNNLHLSSIQLILGKGTDRDWNAILTYLFLYFALVTVFHLRSIPPLKDSEVERLSRWQTQPSPAIGSTPCLSSLFM